MTTSTDTAQPTGSTISETAAVYERMLEAEETGHPTPEEKPKQVVAEAEEAEAGQSEAEEEDADTDTEAEAEADGEGSEEEDEANAEDDQPVTLPLDARVTVKVDGTDVEVTLEEALKGYSRTADYQRKTAALAEARRSFMGEVQQVRQERAQYSALLDTLARQTEEAARSSEPNWEELRQNDPLEYAIKRDEWRETQERRAAIQAEQERLSYQQAQEQAHVIQSFIQAEGQKLLSEIPEFRDPKQRVQTQKAMREYGLSIGWTEAELDQAYDSRAVKALYKAWKYDQLVSGKQPIKKGPTVQATRPKGAPLRAGSANTPPKKVTEFTRAKNRLAKSGSTRDLAAVFEKLL
jgi:hypothetical protein